MTTALPRIEYIEARRVLLDALDAMSAHTGALVLVGAQAVYLRSEGRLAGYQAFTTDADFVLDPSKLGPIPPLGQAMQAAGFVLTAEPGIWEARIFRPGFDDEIVVPVDLIVPEQLAAAAGRRSARPPRRSRQDDRRKSAGLEGAVVDNSPIEIASLERNDARRLVVNVAGVGALLVAKSYANQLFTTPRGVGVQLATQALRGSLPETTVNAFMTTYMGEVFGRLNL